MTACYRAFILNIMWIKRKHYDELIEENEKQKQEINELVKALKAVTAQLNKTTLKLLGQEV